MLIDVTSGLVCCLQAALACCLVALFSMCLWFVRVTVVQRRRQLQLEMQWAANQPRLMTAEEVAALPSELYQVSAVQCHCAGCHPLPSTADWYARYCMELVLCVL